jgi:hypothetical protein
MASARLTKALAEQKVIIKKAPRVSGEVMLTFFPLMDRKTGKVSQPAAISLNGWTPVEPLRRSDVTIDNLRASNLEALVKRQAVVLL